ncbi:MAG: prepilin-type N-terminal cleavage/methylation domain-containing protein [Desulfobacteraceae bacterium]|nr:MAG: prepilin-type N-terminal cleavage/methylation domain-containing protein [Desulfobacteraceae bacterium]
MGQRLITPVRAAGSEKSANNGFTLLELLVVMLLITIVFAVTIPRLDSSLMQDPRKKTTRWVVNTVSELRAMAIETQKKHALVIDLEGGRIWFVHADMDEEALSAASEKAFRLPGGIKIVDVQFPRRQPVSSGTGEIVFYPGGYSEQAVINLEDEDARRFAYKIEPLLPKVKAVDEWLEF